jgi:hypothetical protein
MENGSFTRLLMQQAQGFWNTRNFVKAALKQARDFTILRTLNTATQHAGTFEGKNSRNSQCS